MFRRAFDPDDVHEMHEIVWRWMGRRDVRRDDPSTWARGKTDGMSRSVRTTQVFRDAVSDEFVAAIDQLLGKGSWSKGKDWGSLLYSFPRTDGEPWNVAAGNWHWHDPGLRNLDGLTDLFNFSFISEVQPRGGGTLIADGAHHVLKQYYKELGEEILTLKSRVRRLGFYRFHPWLKELANPNADPTDRIKRFMDEPTDVNGFPVRIIELTGEPGDAMIGHPLLMHCTSMNCSDVPRFMRANSIKMVEEKRH